MFRSAFRNAFRAVGACYLGSIPPGGWADTSRHSLAAATRPDVLASRSGVRGAAAVAALPALRASVAQKAVLLSAALAGAAALAPYPTTTVFAEAPTERSFIMIKPDGVHRGLIAEVIRRFESRGYRLVGIKIVHPTKELASAHYAEHNGKPFFPKLVDFLSSGPVIAMVWEGKEVISTGRKMIGATNPLASAPGTIRGDFGITVGRNIIHGSDSLESAVREIGLWFSLNELVSWKPENTKWVYE
eukprot:tig00000025_g7915.t1